MLAFWGVCSVMTRMVGQTFPAWCVRSGVSQIAEHVGERNAAKCKNDLRESAVNVLTLPETPDMSHHKGEIVTMGDAD